MRSTISSGRALGVSVFRYYQRLSTVEFGWGERLDGQWQIRLLKAGSWWRRASSKRNSSTCKNKQFSKGWARGPCLSPQNPAAWTLYQVIKGLITKTQHTLKFQIVTKHVKCRSSELRYMTTGICWQDFCVYHYPTLIAMILINLEVHQQKKS